MSAYHSLDDVPVSLGQPNTERAAGDPIADGAPRTRYWHQRERVEKLGYHVPYKHTTLTRVNAGRMPMVQLANMRPRPRIHRPPLEEIEQAQKKLEDAQLRARELLKRPVYPHRP